MSRNKGGNGLTGSDAADASSMSRHVGNDVSIIELDGYSCRHEDDKQRPCERNNQLIGSDRFCCRTH